MPRDFTAGVCQLRLRERPRSFQHKRASLTWLHPIWDRQLVEAAGVNDYALRIALCFIKNHKLSVGVNRRFPIAKNSMKSPRLQRIFNPWDVGLRDVHMQPQRMRQSNKANLPAKRPLGSSVAYYSSLSLEASAT